MQRNATEPKTQAGTDRGNVFWAYHDEDGPAKLSTTVAHALADVLGADASVMREELHDCVDLRGLDLLFRDRTDGTPRAGGYLSFRLYDHRVTVYASGDVAIEPPTPSRESPPAV
ncbi:HalOD1 output domain-containing protein [Natronoarchaeum rubrum]|uniref:HalOD1 output domain-containing protein n=1 Tax=Natronoarchaeum rubrum TaxID=755311 RepID=UPI0021129456|nr:HalOD1 output domain-containing protein [Natronoarchaeum rubrum]